ICAVMAFLLSKIPTGFLPQEDQGVGMVIWQLPPGATLTRTEAVAKKVEDHFLGVEKANVDSIFTVSGFSFIGAGQNVGMAFVELADWNRRKDSASAITQKATGMLSQVRDAFIFALTPPAIMGLGT